MLLSLNIRNLVLVEALSLEFGEGLTILTGETGAGKTALLAALGLLFGERTDASKVRQGCEKGRVEASFSLDQPIPFLDETEIVVLAREITAEGKSRSFVNGSAVPANFLQKLAPHLMTFLSQHAHMSLKSVDEQLALLDQFGGVDPLPFQGAWEGEKRLAKELDSLEAQQAEIEAEKEELEEKLINIHALHLGESEEEELFGELSRLSNVQQLQEMGGQALRASEDGHQSTSQLLNLFEKLDAFGSDLLPLGKEAHFAFEELIQKLQSFLSSLQSSPQRLQEVEDRLKEIDKLKKLYGLDLLKVASEAEARLSEMTSLDEQIQEIKAALDGATKCTREEVANLTESRKRAAKLFSAALTNELQGLNMKGAEVDIEFASAPRSFSGEDRVEFLLKANAGESFLPVKDSSSGGELSRLSFAIQLALKDPKRPTTLFFDEIDANVGGESATAMGEKLRSIAEGQQVFCITHFPQVAKFADHHFCVSKTEQKRRTVTTVRPLNVSEREQELHRMLGGSTSALV